MSKHKYEQEFEINASAKIIFPYISTLSGLEQWFAESATVGSNKIWDIVWDGEHHYAIKASEQRGKSVKYEFLDDNKEQEDDPNTLEFVLNSSDFGNGLYIKVVDYSEEDDEEELTDLWEQIIHGLRDIVAG